MTSVASGSMGENTASHVFELFFRQQDDFSQRLYQAVSETCEILFDVRCIDFFSRVTSSGNSAITCGGSEVKKTTGCGVRLRLSEQFARKLTRNFYVMNDEEVGVFHIDKILTLLLDTVIGLTIADRFPMEWGYEVQCQEPVRNISADRNSSLFYQLIKTADNDQLLIEFDNFT